MLAFLLASLTAPAHAFAADSDQDGLPDAVEYQIGTDPFNPDTDGGGVLDGQEVTDGNDPLDPLDDYFGSHTVVVTPGVAGVVNTWRIDGATPNGDVLVLGGRYTGEVFFQSCPNTLINIDDPRILGQITANGAGVALLDRSPPAKWAGEVGLFQVIDLRTCTSSELHGMAFQ